MVALINRQARYGESARQSGKWGQKERAATLVTLWPPALARELVAWMRVPSQPLMRLPLLRFQTPAAPRRAVGFFGFGGSTSRLVERITQPTSGWSILFGPTLSAVDDAEYKRPQSGMQ